MRQERQMDKQANKPQTNKQAYKQKDGRVYIGGRTDTNKHSYVDSSIDKQAKR